MPPEILSTARPSKLRVAGFLAIALGGVLLGVGAVTQWATVSGFDTPTTGIDLWEGLFVLAASFLALIGLVAIRLATPTAARAIAIVVIVIGLGAAGLAAADALRAQTRFTDPGQRDRIARQLAAQSGLPFEPIREEIERQFRLRFSVSLGAGIFLTLAGGVLLVVGGALSLAWIRQREAAPRPTAAPEA